MMAGDPVFLRAGEAGGLHVFPLLLWEVYTLSARSGLCPGSFPLTPGTKPSALTFWKPISFRQTM